MGDYLATHAQALATVKAKGAAVTFSTYTPGIGYDPATDTYATAPAMVSVSGFAVEAGKNPILYQALLLVLAENPTLFFVPTTYDTLPLLGASVTWGGINYTVKSVDPLAPDGLSIAATVVCAR